MKLGNPILPINPESEYDRQLNRRLMDFLRQLVNKVNGIASGAINDSADNGATSVPTSGTWNKGDFVANTNPSEAGTIGAKYVVTGWIRLTSGSGNVLNTDWVPARVLTGN